MGNISTLSGWYRKEFFYETIIDVQEMLNSVFFGIFRNLDFLSDEGVYEAQNKFHMFTNMFAS